MADDSPNGRVHVSGQFISQFLLKTIPHEARRDPPYDEATKQRRYITTTSQFRASGNRRTDLPPFLRQGPRPPQ